MRIALSLLVALPVLSTSAFGWGCEGHQIIALIARAHLTPAVSAAVDRLLRENPIDPSLNRFCKERPNDPMADSATWADDARNIGKTAEWHFIDIPLAVRAGSVPEQDAMKWCPPQGGNKPRCIVTAIDYEWTILRNGGQSAPARANALRYLIHFLGDLTQPLHVSDNRDRGGNCTSIRFFAQKKPQNLHGIWDYQLIARDLGANKTTQFESAKKLDENFSSHWSEWGEAKTDILAWTWESHKLAETVAYADLEPGIPTEAATAGLADREGCNAERDKVAALRISMGDRYAAQAMPVIREQLAKAGYRLAGLLNRTFQ
jgi:hypothetical protein